MGDNCHRWKLNQPSFNIQRKKSAQINYAGKSTKKRRKKLILFRQNTGKENFAYTDNTKSRFLAELLGEYKEF